MRLRGVISAAGVAMQGLVRFCYSLIIGRTLPPGFLSATNSAISTGLFASQLWPTSIGAAAAKFLAREVSDSEIRAVLVRHLGRWCLGTSAVLALIAGAVTYFWLAPGHLLTALLVALVTVGWSTYTYVRSAHYATQRVLRASVWDAVSFVVAIGGLVLVIGFGAFDLLLVPIAVGYLMYAALGWPRGNRGALPLALRREVSSFVSWGVISSSTTAGFLQLTMVIAKQAGDVRSADAYAAALTLATPASMVSSVLSLLLLPALAGAVGRGDLALLRQQTDLAHRGLVALIGAVFGSLILGSRLIVEIIWPNLTTAVPTLQILLLATFFLTSATACSESINSFSSRGPRTTGLVRVAGFAIGLTMVAALTQQGSVIGIATGYLCGMIVIGVVPFALVWRRDHQRWGMFTIRILVGALCAVVLLLIQSTWLSPGWADLLITGSFSVGWLVLFRSDFAAVVRGSARAHSSRQRRADN